MLGVPCHSNDYENQILTNWVPNDMVDILQTTFSNAFSWLKISVVWYKCLFFCSNLQYITTGSVTDDRTIRYYILKFNQIKLVTIRMRKSKGSSWDCRRRHDGTFCRTFATPSAKFAITQTFLRGSMKVLLGNLHILHENYCNFSCLFIRIIDHFWRDFIGNVWITFTKGQ